MKVFQNRKTERSLSSLSFSYRPIHIHKIQVLTSVMSRVNLILSMILETMPCDHFLTLSTSRNHWSLKSVLCKASRIGANLGRHSIEFFTRKKPLTLQPFLNTKPVSILQGYSSVRRFLLTHYFITHDIGVGKKAYSSAHGLPSIDMILIHPYHLRNFIESCQEKGL